MIHPTIFKENKSVLVIEGDKLKQLIEYPKQVLWIRDEKYATIPIETIRKRIRFIGTHCAVTRCLVFVWDENEVAEIPEQIGRELEHCNGTGQ